MPLIKSGSKKAFQKNVENEMSANPGKDKHAQNLAIAYSIQRKNRKKLADGGNVSLEMSKSSPNPYEIKKHPQDIMATSEKRPMPDQEFDDSDEIRRNRSKHMIPKEDYMGSMYYEGGDVKGPKDENDEDEISRNKGAHRDMVNAKHEMRPMPDESDHEQDDYDKDMEERNSRRHSIEDQSWSDRGRGQASNPSEYKMKRPNIPDGDSMQEHLHEEEDDLMDSEKPGSSMIDKIMMKRGGMVKKYADGGEVDLSRNADEDPNMEDDLSFEALKKENYDESSALDQMDQPEDSNQHDRSIDSDDYDSVEKMRNKIKARRGF